MIGMIKGTVEAVDTAAALILAGPVGYEVRMPASDLTRLHAGQETTVHTSLAVSQDAITLYGFLEPAAKRMFLQLQKVSGIGPKVALSLLSTLQPTALAKAVADNDAAALAKAPGLGRKGAQKIILELKGSIDLDALDEAAAPGAMAAEARPPEDTGAIQVVEGLMSLGWRQQDAEHAVRQAIEANHVLTPLAAEDVPRVLKLALTSLDRGR
ncbi:Holliday junction branch migration protein RuvA [Bifidobacterium pullorum subsp. saeculare]|uniref:Holliday junction branch migration complex subunit RuvA n=1 Tax=Bifidobacterium pullorum subsp. saeculare TaxID=78257 RepID=A0A938WXA4_9BIFI|nr:Holliday junction branch migration protein RuvA [Bifidobacterium pullorum]MBM6699313.1 Holliday junction branch migration protein RuvA [Bifidobacterium pullorum subsp. saeculare]